MDFQVVRGNCPCVLKRARELSGASGTEADEGPCLLSPTGLCQVAEGLAAAVPGVAEVSESASDADGTVVVDPVYLSELYQGDFGDVFLFVASPDVRASVRLENSAGLSIEEITWDVSNGRAELIKTIRSLAQEGKRCGVLWIVSDEFEHYIEEDIPNAKIAAISFFSN